MEARQLHDGSDSNGSGASKVLWQRLCQDISNSCDNTVEEKTWFDGSVRDSNESGETAEIVSVQTWFTRPGGSGDREAEVTLRQ